MQFHKIAPQIPNLVVNVHHLDGRKICSNCKCRPVLGYAGNGTVVNNLCGKCYRANPETRERASMKHWVSARKAKS